MIKHRVFMRLTMALAFTGALMAAGCASKPTADELAQLENVQSEIKSLEQRKSALEQERTKLNQSIEGREAQLNTCQTDKTAVKEKLHQ